MADDEARAEEIARAVVEWVNGHATQPVFFTRTMLNHLRKFSDLCGVPLTPNAVTYPRLAVANHLKGKTDE